MKKNNETIPGLSAEFGFSDNKLLTTNQATAYLSVKPNTLAIWRCVKRYDLPYAKIGRKVLYLKSDLDTFIANNRFAGGINV